MSRSRAFVLLLAASKSVNTHYWSRNTREICVTISVPVVSRSGVIQQVTARKQNFFRTFGFSLPWVPEAFLARFPVAAYVLYCDPREKPLVASAERLGLWPISPKVSLWYPGQVQLGDRQNIETINDSHWAASISVYIALPLF